MNPPFSLALDQMDTINLGLARAMAIVQIVIRAIHGAHPADAL